MPRPTSPVRPLLAFATAGLLSACAAPGSGDPTAIDPTAVVRPKDAIGTWALSDNLNNSFNLVLTPGGSAYSTWGRADPARPGEIGSWRIEGGRVIVDLTSGWRDEIIPAANSFAAKAADDPEAPFIASDRFVQESWAPGADRAGPPSNGGRAVKLKGPWVSWVGLWVEAGSSRTWSMQSDNLVFGGEGNPAMGLWHIHTQSVIVQWADARRSELRVKGDHVEVTTVKADGTTTIARLDRMR
jgi:hypothetical protein